MRRILALFLLVFSLCTLVPKAQSEVVDFRTLPDFPIVGYNFLWRADEKTVREQAEMGLTLITVSSPQELDWCKASGIKGICYDPDLNKFLSMPNDNRLESSLQQSIAELKKHPAFYGLQLTDEPSKRVFVGYSKMYEAMKKATAGRPVYTNLFPNWSQPVQHGYKDYTEYLEAFCALYKQYPNPVLVFDNYRNMERLLRPMERIGAFCTNLDEVSKITAKHGMPFWATVAAIAHDYTPEPTEADLNFEVFCSLAYGARGIGYFTTVSHPAMIFQGGPFNVLGDKTPMWLWLRDINYRVRKMATVLNTLKSTGVYLAPTVKDSRILSRFPSLSNLPGKIVKSATDARNEASLLVGEFQDASGAQWVMLVNLNMQAAANVHIQLNGKEKLHSFNSYTGEIIPIFDPWLRAGQGKLYKVIQ